MGKELHDEKCAGCGHDHDQECMDEEEVFTFTDDEGNEVDFYMADTLEFEGREYALFLPVDEEDEEEEDADAEDEEEPKFAILRIITDEQGESSFEPIENEQELEKVLMAWQELEDEEEDQAN